METTEYMRFTLEEANAGKARGWALASYWRPFQMTWWAWFYREVANGT